MTIATAPIITPDEALNWTYDETLAGVVALLAEETGCLPDANATRGGDRAIGSDGVGSNCAEAFANDTFALRDYCWCEGGLHPEVVDWDTEDDTYLEMPPSGGTSSGCPLNFEHFASGVSGEWYKTLGRDMRFNRIARQHEALAILNDCLRSLTVHPGKEHFARFPAVRPAFRLAMGWSGERS